MAERYYAPFSIVTSDGSHMQLPEWLIEHSSVLGNLYDDAGRPKRRRLPTLEFVDSATLENLIECGEAIYQPEETEGEAEAWQENEIGPISKCVLENLDEILHYYIAADYLDLEDLRLNACNQLRLLLRSKSSEALNQEGRTLCRREPQNVGRLQKLAEETCLRAEALRDKLRAALNQC
jgi:hypothetical protein